MVGTTEREVSDIDLDPQPSKDEVQEILERIQKDLPGSGLHASTLHYAFAGLRTLPLRGNKKGVSQLSRKHIWQWSKGVLTLLGGKYTTFAWTASEGVALLLKELGRSDSKVPAALDDLPSSLVGSDLETLQREVVERSGCSGPAVERAVRRMGRAVLSYIGREGAWNEVSAGVLALEVMHALEVEQAETLEDVMRRRVELEFTPSHGMDGLEAISSLLAPKLDAIQVAVQAQRWLERLNELHGILGLPLLRGPTTTE
jgi:glycerol-3-phosphate dehydrogenase